MKILAMNSLAIIVTALLVVCLVPVWLCGFLAANIAAAWRTGYGIGDDFDPPSWVK